MKRKNNKREHYLFEDEEDVSKEDASDLAPLSQELISRAVVSATDWTTETVVNQIQKGSIMLNPRWQRRDAWDIKRKSKFIESLILGFPIPQLVLAEGERKGTYIVIDGKQRLLSLVQFVGGGDNYELLRLKGLEILTELNGSTWSSLQSNKGLRDAVSAFENQPIRTVVIRNWGEENILYHIFLRLNTGSVQLSPQELRQALHPGPFVDFADEASGASPSLRKILKRNRPDFRMRDVELLVRFYGFYNFLEDYSGSMKQFLDLTCQRLNVEWKENSDVYVAQAEAFEAGCKFTEDTFKDNSFRKWAVNKYETRFNRAVYDIMLFYFSKSDVRKKLVDRKKELECKFRSLCESDRRFLESIERTTKSIDNTLYRLEKWGSALKEVSGSEIDIPKLADGRIIL